MSLEISKTHFPNCSLSIRAGRYLDGNNGYWCAQQKASFCIPRQRNGFSISVGFFLAKGLRWKIVGATMIDAFADGRRRRKRGEKKEALYIRDALSVRDGRTDLHQGNHGYTSYGRSLYTRVYRFIDESLVLYSASPSDGTFLVGREQKSRTVN